MVIKSPTDTIFKAKKKLTKDETKLEDHLLRDSAQGNFGFILPMNSSRLNIMMRVALGNTRKETDADSLEYMKGFIYALRERCADLCITHFAEKVGAVVAFTDSENYVHWRFCSLEKGGKLCFV